MKANQMTTIGSIAEIYDGPHATPKKLEQGPYFLSISSLDKGRLELKKSSFISENDFKNWTKRITPQEGDLLFSYETRLGEAALMPAGVRACLGRRMGLLRLNRAKVTPEYALYAYLSPAFQQTIKANTITGATVDRIALNDLPNFPIRIPPLSEQEYVAKLLSGIDKKIELNNRINVELEAMAKTLYDYWFVQFEFPNANGKPYKTSGGKMVYNPTLKRNIPEGWSDGKIEDVIGKVPQATKVPAKEFKEHGKFPVIDQSQAYICGFTDDETAKIKPVSAHVIFGDHTRAVKLVNFDYARGADGTQVLVAKSDEVPSYLLYQIVSGIDLSSYGYARHYKFLKESKCVIPRSDISQIYQVTVVSWYEKIRGNIFQNYELQRLRDWLLPMLMNGQVTVK
ncbi:restriction endonuclease subunit S [Aeromonas allosaccharophila]|uniref:restriction endonuclease subunit S n=1 Tax=Aeromonas allosaccharophila TaxID=656 RepID=UPI0039871F2C